VQNIEDIYELSHTQQGMLFHTLYAPESGVYFEQISCVLQGGLDIDAFQRAWQRTAERHAIFRTSFMWEDLDRPVQIVHTSTEIPWIIEDWCDLPPKEQELKLETFLQKDRGQGFELDRAPLMRCALFREVDDAYRFVWSHHHLLMDGWCLPIVLKDVFTLYSSFGELAKDFDPSQASSPPPRPYRDYILWLQQQDLADAESYWRKTLKGFNAPTPLVVDQKSAPVPHTTDDTSPNSETLRLPADSTHNLQRFAKNYHITLSTLVQGIWAILLSRYSGETDIVFGSIVSGRPSDLQGVENMVGLFRCR